MEDFPISGNLIGLEWAKKLNGIPGLIAIVASIIFVFSIIFTFIVRLFQFRNLRKRYFISDNTQSIHTRVLKAIVYLFLIAGLIGVIIYNVNKLKNDTPKLSVTLEENESSPSMLICSSASYIYLNLVHAEYSTSFNNLNNISNSLENNKPINGTKVILKPNGNCYFFNGSLPRLRFDKGGVYNLQFESNYSSVVFFIGDTDSKMEWNLTIPQGNSFSDVGALVLYHYSIIQYTETQHLALNGTLYRSFQSFVIINPVIPVDTPANGVNQTFHNIFILAPRTVTKRVEEPSLTLVDIFSNIGGYLGICGIFSFLFGSSKMDPFGFVSWFVFIKQDRAKFLKELEKMKDDRNTKLNISDEEEKNVVVSATETSNLSNQTELKNLLAKYYIDMDFYEHAVKSPDV
ncbi:hypothetical protein RhiirB3_446477 [Rhizophagus irregularis]|nr:hypothetical protein RhiirB3_446477 [Rhizophagus irregularis]